VSRYTELQKLAEAGIRLDEVAQRLGLSLPGLSVWARKHAPDLYETLKRNAPPSRSCVSQREAIRRLKLGLRIERAGLTPFQLAAWLKVNAPDGAADALEDLMPNV
jgi:hypothetical protein